MIPSLYADLGYRQEEEGKGCLLFSPVTKVFLEANFSKYVKKSL